jgi:undecaprenol kinase/diacylglycerol kinase (ATP)
MIKNKQNFSLRRRIKSFAFAISGIKILFIEEHNSWIHSILAIGAIGLGLYCDISIVEWMFIIFAIGFVFVTEIINTAIENIGDFISPQKHESLKRIKDLAAASVLVSAIATFIIALLIFIPKLIGS